MSFEISRAGNLEQETIRVVRHFNDALNRRDLAGMSALLSEDCVFENTYPPPDGERFTGRQSVIAFFEQLLSSSREPWIEIIEIFACEERCTSLWIYTWKEPDGATGHVRGVDIFRVRDGKVAEKLSYVKG